MNTEDRLTELLRDTADAYVPPEGRRGIEQKVAGHRRARRIRRVALPVAAAVIVAAVAVPLYVRGGKHASQRITNVPPVTTAVPSEPTTAPAPSPKPVAAPSLLPVGRLRPLGNGLLTMSFGVKPPSREVTMTVMGL